MVMMEVKERKGERIKIVRIDDEKGDGIGIVKEIEKVKKGIEKRKDIMGR